MTERATGLARTLSAVAVVLSLVFVGLEIRQNTASQRSQTRQFLSDASREFLLTIGADEHATRVFYGVFLRPDDLNVSGTLTSVDSVQAFILIAAGIRNAENVFFQWQEGVIDQSVLASYGFVSSTFQRPGFAEWWVERGNRDNYGAEFVLAFEQATGIR